MSTRPTFKRCKTKCFVKLAQKPTRHLENRRPHDKQIAEWIGTSLPTFYRWIRDGLITSRPNSKAEAKKLRAAIEAARDAASFNRPPQQRGRTSIRCIAKVLRQRV